MRFDSYSNHHERVSAFYRIHHGHHGVHDHPGSGSPAGRESIGVDPLLFGMIMSVNLLILGLATPL